MTPGPWVGETEEAYGRDGRSAPKVGTGWINGPDSRPVLQYAGCGSHNAEWMDPEDFALVLAAPDLLEFARLVARMKTEEEAGGFTAEDAVATVNDLIETARLLVYLAPAQSSVRGAL